MDEAERLLSAVVFEVRSVTLTAGQHSCVGGIREYLFLMKTLLRSFLNEGAVTTR